VKISRDITCYDVEKLGISFGKALIIGTRGTILFGLSQKNSYIVLSQFRMMMREDQLSDRLELLSNRKFSALLIVMVMPGFDTITLRNTSKISRSRYIHESV